MQELATTDLWAEEKRGLALRAQGKLDLIEELLSEQSTFHEELQSSQKLKDWAKKEADKNDRQLRGT